MKILSRSTRKNEAINFLGQLQNGGENTIPEKAVKKDSPSYKRCPLFKTKMMNAALEAPVKLTGYRRVHVPLCFQLATEMGCFYAAGHADWLFDEADLRLISLLFFLFHPF